MSLGLGLGRIDPQLQALGLEVCVLFGPPQLAPEIAGRSSGSSSPRGRGRGQFRAGRNVGRFQSSPRGWSGRRCERCRSSAARTLARPERSGFAVVVRPIFHPARLDIRTGLQALGPRQIIKLRIDRFILLKGEDLQVIKRDPIKIREGQQLRRLRYRISTPRTCQRFRFMPTLSRIAAPRRPSRVASNGFRDVTGPPLDSAVRKRYLREHRYYHHGVSDVSFIEERQRYSSLASDI